MSRSGGQAPWTQRNVFANQPTVRRQPSQGLAGTAPHAGKKRHHRSALSWGIATVHTTLLLALAARDRELRVERARSDTLAVQHATLSRARTQPILQ